MSSKNKVDYARKGWGFFLSSLLVYVLAYFLVITIGFFNIRIGISPRMVAFLYGLMALLLLISSSYYVRDSKKRTSSLLYAAALTIVSIYLLYASFLSFHYT